ncbi:hypothetical protein RCH11_003744, partial [Glaciihabitans sp. GrIS 2.15]|nr:hypothetical protein [Glaciihabitans sp. GrIS 2.15]
RRHAQLSGELQPDPSRWPFRLPAAASVEKWSPPGCSDTGKSSPLIVRLMGEFVSSL